MENVLHKGLTQERWFGLSLVEQLGNVGSEVGRAINWQRKEDSVHRDKALERALELFDMTIADPRWKNRLKEILRTREVVCDMFYGDNQYNIKPEELDKYFNQFAYAARLERDNPTSPLSRPSA